MGCDYNFTCETCRETYLLGYGPSSTWLCARVDTLEEYDAFPDPENNKNLAKNQNYRRCLVEHAGHQTVVWSHDWNHIRSDGHLYADCGEVAQPLVVRDIASFRRINLSP